MKQNRLVTIQDLSCFGKCSLTVALPVISALGIETAVLPTAVLSTHTGGKFRNYTFHSLENEFEKIADNWEEQDINFDAIYVGYIGSLSLINEVSAFIDRFKKNAVVFIDPAMADNGEFYRGLDEEYAEALSVLCRKADIISPNYTEALILAGFSPDSEIAAEELSEKLSHISQNVIITGIHSADSVITACRAKEGMLLHKASRPLQHGDFYGSGDLFASAFIGLYVNGASLEYAVEKASDFVYDCIQKTLDEKEKYWYGLKFEQSLGLLTEEFLKGADGYGND